MKHVDVSTWRRRQHYEFFHGMDYPQFNVCFNIEITALLPKLKAKGYSFYYSMLYFSTCAANRVEEFRYRIKEGQVVVYDIIHPSFTDMSKGDDLFKMVTVDIKESLPEFVAAAAEKSKRQTEYFPIKELVGRDDVIYFTCLPWTSFTHLSHTIRLNRDDAVPRISWGKYFEENGKILLPFSVQVHHAFADGIHVGRYQQELEQIMKEWAASVK